MTPRFRWSGRDFSTLNAALRAAAFNGTEEEAVIIAPMRGLDYLYKPATGELWRLRLNAPPQRMADRRF